MKYCRARSRLICSSIRDHGSGARIALPLSEMAAVQWRILPTHENATKIVLAAELAVARIEELEARIHAAGVWQEQLLAQIEALKPATMVAENWMGWRLFCEGARSSYRTVQRLVADAIVLRVKRDLEREQQCGCLD